MTLMATDVHVDVLHKSPLYVHEGENERFCLCACTFEHTLTLATCFSQDIKFSFLQIQKEKKTFPLNLF